jgi:hypothetical protein
MKPGTYFRCRPIENLYPPTGLHRTASTYEYGNLLETQPDPSRLYVLCKDGSVQDIQNPERPIGWELGDGWYRLTQVGFEPKKCEVIVRGTIDPVPIGKGAIGSQIFFTGGRVDEVRSRSQDAQIQDFCDEGEEEVSSLKT